MKGNEMSQSNYINEGEFVPDESGFGGHYKIGCTQCGKDVGKELDFTTVRCIGKGEEDDYFCGDCLESVMKYESELIEEDELGRLKWRYTFKQMSGS
jgi:hypothetical protein